MPSVWCAVVAAALALVAARDARGAAVLKTIKSVVTTTSADATFTFANGATVDPTRSFVIYSQRFRSRRPDEIFFTAQLSATGIRVRRQSATSTQKLHVAYQVVEFAPSSNVRVLHATHAMTSRKDRIDVSALLNFTKANAFIMHRWRIGGASIDANDFITAQVIDDAFVEFENRHLATTGSGVQLSYQLVSYPEATVYHLQAFEQTANNIQVNTAPTTENTWVLGSVRYGSSSSSQESRETTFQYSRLSSNVVQAARTKNNARVVDIFFQVVDFGNSGETVTPGGLGFSRQTNTFSKLIGYVSDIDRSVISDNSVFWGARSDSGSRDKEGEVQCVLTLSPASGMFNYNINAHRGDDGTADDGYCSISYSVVTWPAPTQMPTRSPTHAPTTSPTAAPTASPTKSPTRAPTDAPTSAPTVAPTPAPTATASLPTTTTATNSSLGGNIIDDGGIPSSASEAFPLGATNIALIAVGAVAVLLLVILICVCIIFRRRRGGTGSGGGDTLKNQYALENPHHRRAAQQGSVTPRGRMRPTSPRHTGAARHATMAGHYGNTGAAQYGHAGHQGHYGTHYGGGGGGYGHTHYATANYGNYAANTNYGATNYAQTQQQQQGGGGTWGAGAAATWAVNAGNAAQTQQRGTWAPGQFNAAAAAAVTAAVQQQRQRPGDGGGGGGGGGGGVKAARAAGKYKTAEGLDLWAQALAENGGGGADAMDTVMEE